MREFYKESRFDGIKSFDNKIWLASPTMHGEEREWVKDAFEMIEA